MRLTSFCHPSLSQRAPILVRSRFSVTDPRLPESLCVHPTGCARQDRGIERFTTPESLRRVARAVAGVFFPSRVHVSRCNQPLTPLSRLPLATNSLAAFAVTMAAEGLAELASTPKAVTPTEFSRTKVPSLGK